MTAIVPKRAAKTRFINRRGTWSFHENLYPSVRMRTPIPTSEPISPPRRNKRKKIEYLRILPNFEARCEKKSMRKWIE
jgi:hypothetical protein